MIAGKATQLSKFKEFITGNGLGILVNVITVGTVSIAGFSWINAKFEEFAEQRLEAYEYIILANSLRDVGDYDKAIEAYEKAFDGFIKLGINDERLSSIIDPYLGAIASSEKPHEFEPHFKKVLKVADEKLPPNGERYENLGWIYLYTDRANEAEQAFTKAISLYKLNDDEFTAVTSYWGLSLLYLSLGNLEKGLEYYYEAWNLDYSSYNPEETVNDQWIESKYGQQLVILYPELSPTYTRYLAYLKEVHAVKDRVELPEIDQEKVNKILSQDDEP